MVQIFTSALSLLTKYFDLTKSMRIFNKAVTRHLMGVGTVNVCSNKRASLTGVRAGKGISEK